jgi:hypothetical protein
MPEEMVRLTKSRIAGRDEPDRYYYISCTVPIGAMMRLESNGVALERTLLYKHDQMDAHWLSVQETPEEIIRLRTEAYQRSQQFDTSESSWEVQAVPLGDGVPAGAGWEPFAALFDNTDVVLWRRRGVKVEADNG